MTARARCVVQLMARGAAKPRGAGALGVRTAKPWRLALSDSRRLPLNWLPLLGLSRADRSRSRHSGAATGRCATNLNGDVEASADPAGEGGGGASASAAIMSAKTARVGDQSRAPVRERGSQVDIRAADWSAAAARKEAVRARQTGRHGFARTRGVTRPAAGAARRRTAAASSAPA
jgi:hypothetical protein